jgi:hypothetical protein
MASWTWCALMDFQKIVARLRSAPASVEFISAERTTERYNPAISFILDLRAGSSRRDQRLIHTSFKIESCSRTRMTSLSTNIDFRRTSRKAVPFGNWATSSDGERSELSFYCLGNDFNFPCRYTRRAQQNEYRNRQSIDLLKIMEGRAPK